MGDSGVKPNALVDYGYQKIDKKKELMGFKYSVISGDKLNLFLQMLRTESHIDAMASPEPLTSNNMKAQFQETVEGPRPEDHHDIKRRHHQLDRIPERGHRPHSAAAGQYRRVYQSLKDVAAIGNTDLQSRLAVFPALPTGDKYELVLFEAEHLAFTDRVIAAGAGAKRNPNHHRVILALSTAFWDSFLAGDAKAKAWLNGNGPSLILEKEDKWQKK